MNLAARSELPERMDAPELESDIYARCLADLASVNRVTFTHRATLAWLARATADLAPGAAFSVLDVAYGQGDLLRAIARAAAKCRVSARLEGVDMNPRSAAAARAGTPAAFEIAYHTGDVFEFVPRQKPDFIVSSQFAHHLPGPQIVRLLRWMEANAGRGWHIADLHRHRLAYTFYPLLARAMRWHEIVRQDGAVSIARGFTAAELAAYCAEAGVPAKITWRLPFRYTVSRLK